MSDAQQSEASSPQSDPRLSRRGRRWTVAIIALLVALWCIAMWYRVEIRAYWWARQLARSTTPQDTHYYLLCLASTKESAFGPAKGLVRNNDPHVRRLGIAALDNCYGPKVEQVLLDLLSDPDDEVGDAAALSLTDPRRGTAIATIPKLQSIVTGDGKAARRAVVALQRIPGEQTETILVHALSQTSDPHLLAQLADSLGMIGSRAAVPRLIALLEDARPLHSMLYSERSAARALAGARGQLTAKGIDSESITVSRARTVADAALRSLLLIAGRSAPTTATLPAETQPAATPREQWEAWWKSGGGWSPGR